MSGVEGVFHNVLGFSKTACAVQVSQGGEGTSDDLLGGVYDPLERCPLCYCAAPEPHTDAVGHDTLDRASVEGHQQFLRELVVPEYSQEVQSLVCLLDDGRGVGAPG